MHQGLGARLRQRREEQEIALTTIAEQTKISLYLLEALERDDVSHWPSGIFRRAFIRAYAHAIGLNPDVVVREFLAIYPEPAEVVATASAIASAAEGARRNGGPPTRLRHIVGSAIGSLSRFRRSPAAEDLGVADDAQVNSAAEADLDLRAAAHPSPDSGHVGKTTEVVIERTTVGVPVASEPDLPVVSHPFPEPSQVDRANGVVGKGTPMEPSQVERTNGVVAGRTEVNDPASSGPDILAVAELCTEFGLVENTSEVQPLLEEAARILDAIGLIVWVWDGVAEQLRPALAHGYSDKVLAQLPTVRRDANNATAAAFRSAQTCAINGSDTISGALVVPLLIPAGCAGVLAIELQHGTGQTRSMRAAATIFAAALAQLIGCSRPAEVRPERHDSDSLYETDTSDTAPGSSPTEETTGMNRSAGAAP